jgi:hypothetical protein
MTKALNHFEHVRTIRVYSPFFPFPVTGGSPQVIADQARILSQKGFDLEMVTWKDSLAVAQDFFCPSACVM